MFLIVVQFILMLCTVFVSGYHFGKGNDILGWVILATSVVLVFKISIGLFNRWRER